MADFVTGDATMVPPGRTCVGAHGGAPIIRPGRLMRADGRTAVRPYDCPTPDLISPVTTGCRRFRRNRPDGQTISRPPVKPDGRIVRTRIIATATTISV